MVILALLRFLILGAGAVWLFAATSASAQTLDCNRLLSLASQVESGPINGVVGFYQTPVQIVQLIGPVKK